jgi:hypothetical protein
MLAGFPSKLPPGDDTGTRHDGHTDYRASPSEHKSGIWKGCTLRTRDKLPQRCDFVNDKHHNKYDKRDCKPMLEFHGVTPIVVECKG